jgi:hypothetical protein
MPLVLVLIILGIILICAAYYLPMPPPLHSLCMFLGVALVIIGIVVLLYDLLKGAVL